MIGKKKKYSGVVVPMVTPLNIAQGIDREAVRRLIGPVLDAGAAPFVLGSTGEGHSLSFEQKIGMVEAAAEVTGKEKVLYAGIQSNSLSSALSEAHTFAARGADILVATLPFYYPIDPEQMLRFFHALADESPLPIMLYNMPGLTKQSIPLSVADKLSQHKNVIGLKDSERNKERLFDSIQRWSEREDFSFFVGWAAMSFEGLNRGADGIVPSTGNLCPSLYVSLLEAVASGDKNKALELQNRTNDISKLYQEGKDLSHSIPALKLMLRAQGKCQKTVAPPLYEMSLSEEELFLSEVAPKMNKLACT